jgi:hypothetical protein
LVTSTFAGNCPSRREWSDYKAWYLALDRNYTNNVFPDSIEAITADDEEVKIVGVLEAADYTKIVIRPPLW